VHLIHAFVGFEIDAAGVEANAFADEREFAELASTAGAIAQTHDARATMLICATDRQECTRTRTFERSFI
jgi:hypothetical protein